MPRSPRRLVLSGPALGTLLILAATSCFFALGVGRFVRDQEHRLLVERAQEAGDFVGTFFNSTMQPLPALASGAPTPGAPSAAFIRQAKADMGLFRTIGVMGPVGGRLRVLVSTGGGVTVGSAVASDRGALAATAAARHGAAEGRVRTGQGHHLSIVLPAPNGEFLFADFAFDPTRTYSLGSSDIFSELRGALYASTTPDPNQLVLTTDRPIVTRGSVRQTIPVGTQSWLIVVSARQPLVGGVAAKAAWAVLAGGLALCLVATGLVESLQRRRRYAIALVEEKTLDLRMSLTEQARLEHQERRARQAAEEANRTKSEFLSRMSHELRTPLNAILGFGQLLQLDELSSPQKESVDQILKGGRHLLNLINEVLDISRIEAGTMALSPESVSTVDLIDEVVGMLAPLAEASDVTLIRPTELTSDEGRSEHVIADRQRLKQVLVNLAANAIKYNRPAGRVEITVIEPEPGWLRVSVRDTGQGIRPADLPRLFTAFDRLGQEASSIEGTGVGLALCHRLTEAMHGRMGVESEEGVGSCFWVDLPRAEAPVDAFDRIHGQAVQPSGGAEPIERHRVLYIEDNPANRRLLERVVALRDDVDLLCAELGGLGLELARQRRPALVLLDIHLPDRSGVDVLAALRDDPLTASIPVVMLSADATPGQTAHLLEAGARAYLTKPLDVAELMSLLDELLRPLSPVLPQ